MNGQNGKDPFDSKLLEDWFDQFFLDPLTSYLDETVFRIDLYDSESAFIVEAVLPGIHRENIEIQVHGQDLIIKVNQTNNVQATKEQIKTRKVTFPIPIHQLKMDAYFEQGILEIKLYKDSDTI